MILNIFLAYYLKIKTNQPFSGFNITPWFVLASTCITSGCSNLMHRIYFVSNHAGIELRN